MRQTLRSFSSNKTKFEEHLEKNFVKKPIKDVNIKIDEPLNQLGFKSIPLKNVSL